MNDVNSFSNPRTLAVVGDSKTPGKIGYSLVNNIKKSGFPREIFPIKPKEKEILGLNLSYY